MSQTMVYSEERGTWNLIVNGEWYMEGTYEQCSDAMFTNDCGFYEDQVYVEEEEW